MSVHTIAAIGVLVIPILGVFLLRYLRTRLTAVPFYSIGGLVYGLAALAAIVLVRARIETVQVGNLVLTQPQGIDLQLPFDLMTTQPATQGIPATAAPPPSPSPASSATAAPSATPQRTATLTLPPAPTGLPTASPTASPSATLEVPATAAPEPTAGTRTYTVQPGDTLRSIADDFGVSVQQIIEANDLSPAEADALQPGDTLIIP